MTRPLIGILGASLGGGGGERHFAYLAKNLFGGKCVPIVFKTSKESYQDLTSVVDLGWRSHWSYPRMLERMRRLLEARSFDVLLAIGQHACILGWAAIRLSGAGTRLVALEITRPSTAFRFLSNGPTRCLERSLMTAAYQSCARVLANSTEGRAECVADFGADGSRTSVVLNPIDGEGVRLAALSPCAHHWPVRKPLVVVVSRIDHLKRVELVIRAIAQVRRRLEVHLAIAGSGNPALVEELKVLTRVLGIEEDVSFLGWKENPYPILSSGSVFVTASALEGFPNTVLEAMLLEVPVISSAWGEEVSRLAGAGALVRVDSGDPGVWADAIERVLTDVSLREKLVAAASETVSANELPKVLREYEEVLTSVACG